MSTVVGATAWGTNLRRLHFVSAFRRWDADNDGLLSEADLRQLLVEAGVPARDAPGIFATADKNKDGKVDYDEFMAWVFASGEDTAKEAVRTAAAAVALPWPKDPSAVLSASGLHPEKLRLATPAPCSDCGVTYWAAGGPSKARVRVTEDAGALRLGTEFTVGVRFRLPPTPFVASMSGYDTLLMGNDSRHWLAVECSQRRLCCVDGKSGKSVMMDYIVPCGEWLTLFLRPRGASATAVFAFDAQGLVEVGAFDGLSLSGSRLDKLGWADGEVHIADVRLWPREVPWREMAAVHPPPPPPAQRPRTPTAADKRRRSFRGRVVDIAGCGLDGVDVRWSKGKCRTDEDGCFEASLSDAETDVPEDSDAGDAASDGAASSHGAGGGGGSAASGSTATAASEVFCFAGEGLAPTTAVGRCERGGAEASLRITMRRISASTEFDMTKGGAVVDVATGSSVTVPPGALAYPDGSPVEGNVTVSLSVIDVTDPASLASMPGDFSAVGEDGAQVFLQSLGAVWLGAEDAQGRELAVKDGGPGVTLDLKSKATADAGKLGADAELWTFNEATGRWELEQKSLLKVDGQVVPNSAARVSQPVSAPRRKPIPQKGKKKAYKKSAGYMDSDDEDAGPVFACMTPEAFRDAVAKEGEKTLSANITKLGYINCDLAYHHPQRAVMLKGVVLGADRLPMEGAQLWSVGRDYNGRCPDVSGAGGLFGSMIAQFDSNIDVEVHLQVPGSDNTRLSLSFENGAKRGVSTECLEILRLVEGMYYLEEDKGTPRWSKRKLQKELPDVSVAWYEPRRQWQIQVDGKPIYARAADDVDIAGAKEADVGLPFGGYWRPASASASLSSSKTPVSLSNLPLPQSSMPKEFRTFSFGPFTTGPPGEFVDIGELVVDTSAKTPAPK